MRRDLPSGTVTFLFTDVEGSTKLLHELGAEGYSEALTGHRRVIREACAAHDGVEVDTQGDAFFFAFPTAPGALAAAGDMTEALASGQVQVRVGLHTGTPLLTEEGYVGGDVHRAARIAAAGHGGQVLVSSSTAPLVELELRDLGEHRLKDLSAPERIYQLGDGEFPALKSLYRTNLPVPTTPFLGRERELSEVVELLSRDEARLLTLTGPGGTGKTRLAAQAAGLASDSYPDGVWWIPLAPLRDPKLVLETAAQVVGSKNGLAEHIADKELLLLFDNFEHVVGAATDVASLLVSCPKLDLLVTSREPLHVTGEQEYPVPPLVHEEGVGFFLARARAVRLDFQVDDGVSEICRRLDDLPLALELAAARVKALSSAQILERLEQRLPLLTGGARDLPERQRTLRATIEWSYDLLPEEEQRLFARLAVFRGGCTLEAAEEVADADLDTLQSLVDKSLLRHSQERYWMLATIREYAAERFDESGDADAVSSRHAEWFLRLAEEAEPEVLHGDQVTWGQRLDVERDNCRTALSWLLKHGHAELAHRLIGALRRPWAARGYLNETHRWLEAALAQEGKVSPRVRAKALYGLGRVALLQGDYDEAVRQLELGEALYSALDDAEGLVYSFADLCWIAAAQGDHRRAAALGERSLGYARRAGSDSLISAALHSLACAHLDQGDYAQARRLFEESLLRRRRLRDTRNTANSLLHLGIATLLEGDHGQATALLEESLSLVRELENLVLEAAVLLGLGLVALFEGTFERGADLIGEGLVLCSRLGDKRTAVECLHALAGVSAAAGDLPRAATLSGAGEALLMLIHAPPSPAERAVQDRFIAPARVKLGEDAFANAYAAGREMSLERAVEYALGGDDA